VATQIVPAPVRADHQASAMSDADRRAHELASYVRRPAASTEREKVKDPLPTRPRGPHPQRVTAAV
jgi:hypothetical protein